MRVRNFLLPLTITAALAICVIRASAAPRAESDSKRNAFVGLKDFSDFTKSSGEKAKSSLYRPRCPCR